MRLRAEVAVVAFALGWSVASPAQAEGERPEAGAGIVAAGRESGAFQHVQLTTTVQACPIGSVCHASWRIAADGHIVHRDGDRIFEGTVPPQQLAALATLAVSEEMVAEVRQPEPCPDRTRLLSEIEIGFVPGLFVNTQTGDCEGHLLGRLTGAVRRVASALFPTSRSSDDSAPRLDPVPPALGLRQLRQQRTLAAGCGGAVTSCGRSAQRLSGQSGPARLPL